MPNSLTYFRVDATVLDIEQPLPSGTTIVPQLDDVSAYVDFFPGTLKEALQIGMSLLVPDFDRGGGVHGDTDIQLAPITGRLINGSLCTVAIGDPKGVDLVANSSVLALPELYYHVRFTNVTYGGAVQRISNFAFQAPTGATPVLLTSTTLARFPYAGP